MLMVSLPLEDLIFMTLNESPSQKPTFLTVINNRLGKMTGSRGFLAEEVFPAKTFSSVTI